MEDRVVVSWCGGGDGWDVGGYVGVVNLGVEVAALPLHPPHHNIPR